MPKNATQLLRGLFLAGAVAVGLALYAAWQVVGEGYPLWGVLPLMASFGCLGLLLGAIYAFDEASEIKIASHPLARVSLSSVAGLSLGLLWHWPVDGIALSVLVSAFLGYLGMLWAKYVDF